MRETLISDSDSLMTRSISLLCSPRTTAQCVAYIAASELPANQWPDLIQRLLSNVSGVQNTEAVKEASLEAIGYICEELVSW